MPMLCLMMAYISRLSIFKKALSKITILFLQNALYIPIKTFLLTCYIRKKLMVLNGKFIICGLMNFPNVKKY